jgi:quaternary ammonium compound-resistance protein SugE
MSSLTSAVLSSATASWAVLAVSGLLEAVWATALSRSHGLTRLAPTLVFALAVTLSMAGLALAMRTIPVGTAYAVWVGIGAATTVAYAMITGAEPTTAVRVALIAGLIACVVGLKLTGDPATH